MEAGSRANRVSGEVYEPRETVDPRYGEGRRGGASLGDCEQCGIREEGEVAATNVNVYGDVFHGATTCSSDSDRVEARGGVA